MPLQGFNYSMQLQRKCLIRRINPARKQFKCLFSGCNLSQSTYHKIDMHLHDICISACAYLYSSFAHQGKNRMFIVMGFGYGLAHSDSFASYAG